MKRLIPKPVRDAYHRFLAHFSAMLYGNPSRELFVIGVTGTKGKSTTAELIRAILTEAGYQVALSSTIHFLIGREAERNLFKMSMPGRGYLQKFLRKAVAAGCTHAVIEMTSEGAAQFRHKGIELNALVFTNLQREHIESHGSMEAYAEAKLLLAKHLEESPKRPRFIVANDDDPYGKRFLDIDVEHRIPFSLKDAEPYTADDKSVRFVWKRGDLFTIPLPGLFNLRNVLAALSLAEAMRIPRPATKRALEHIAPIAGRQERINEGQKFLAVVDYAHTPDSLQALFETYKTASKSNNRRLICVFGATGGGRDHWKRAEMGKVADALCDVSILTNDDPYDEDPDKIVKEIAKGFKTHKPHIEIDRRKAIARGLAEAKEGDAVLIAGKGTDPYLMVRHGKLPWSDSGVVREELKKLLHV